MSNYDKEVKEALERWSEDAVEIIAAREQKAYNEGFDEGVAVISDLMTNYETIYNQIIWRLYYKALDLEIQPGMFKIMKDILRDIIDELKEYTDEWTLHF